MELVNRPTITIGPWDIARMNLRIAAIASATESQC